MLVLLWVVAGQYLLVVTKELDSTIIRLCLSKTYVIMNYTVANIITIHSLPLTVLEIKQQQSQDQVSFYFIRQKMHVLGLP